MLDDMPMEELLNSLPEEGVRKGQRVNARILEFTAEGALLDIGSKIEGLLPRAEFASYDVPPFRKDEVISVVVGDTSKFDEGHPTVSWKAARLQDLAPVLEGSLRQETPLEAKVLRAVKGGLVVDLGVEAFLPASQIDLQPVKNSASWVGQTISVVVIDLQVSKANIVVSRRKLLDKARLEQRQKTLASLEVGRVYSGMVRSLAAYGAFVDIGGIDGLLHISDVSWGKAPKLSDLFKTGQALQVKLLNYDPATQKISLGLKQLSPHPWEGVQERFRLNTEVKGKVKSLSSFGIFVELAEGVEGLVHSTEVSWKKVAGKLNQYAQVGKEMTVRILAIDAEKRKISLSLKRVGGENPWATLKERYAPGSRVKGTVSRITPFGAFVRIADDLEGLLHASDLSWSARAPKPADVLKIGQDIELVIREIRPQEEKVSLSLKHMTPDPLTLYRKGKSVEGKIVRVTPAGVALELPDGIQGFVRGAEFNEDFAAPKVGETAGAKVMRADVKDRRLELSIRAYEKESERETIKKYTRPERISLGRLFEDDAE